MALTSSIVVTGRARGVHLRLQAGGAPGDPVARQRAGGLEGGEVFQGTLGVDHHRESGGVGSDHEVASQPALEREVRDSERTILVGEMAVPQVVQNTRLNVQS